MPFADCHGNSRPQASLAIIVESTEKTGRMPRDDKSLVCGVPSVVPLRGASAKGGSPWQAGNARPVFARNGCGGQSAGGRLRRSPNEGKAVGRSFSVGR